MKTLFIQTHELAKALDPSEYTCLTLNDILRFKSGRHNAYFVPQASVIMKMLYLEQKEDRHWQETGFCVFEDIFVVHNTGRHTFTYYQYVEFRKRLINSLLTRPDRTLCVLIPE